MSMATVDGLPEFCCMLLHMTASKPKRTEVEVDTPSNRTVPTLECRESGWDLGDRWEDATR